MRYAANVSMLYPELPLLERPAAAAADGFAGIEVLFPYLPDVEVGELARAAAAAGVAVVLVNTPLGDAGEVGFAAVPGGEDRFRAGFAAALQAATVLGCPTIHTMAGRLGPDTARGHARAALLANLAWAAPRAADSGVALTLEALNHHDVPGYFYAVPGEACEVLAELDAANVGLQFDLYHTVREGLEPLAELQAAAPFIRHCQIAGADGRHEPDLSQHGLGAAIAWLAEHYRGWLGFEYRPKAATSDGLAWRAGLPPEGGGAPAGG